MRIPRYSSGAANVGLLESGKQALRSPSEAAAAAGGGLQAVGSALMAGGDAIAAYDKAKQATQIADDKLALSRMESESQTALERVWNDAQENNLSADETEEALNKVFDSRQDILGKMQHPDNIRNIPQALRLSTEAMREEQRGNLITYAAARTTDEFNAQVTNARESGNIPQMMLLMDIGLDAGTIGEADAALLNTEINQMMFNQEVDKRVELGFSAMLANPNDPDVKSGVYKKASQISDPDVRAAVLSGLNTASANVDKIHLQEREQEESDLIFYEQGLSEQISAGASVDLMLEYEQGKLGDEGTVSATKRYERLRDQQISGVKANDDQIDFAQRYLNGEPMPATKPFREQADRYLENLTVPEGSNYQDEKAKFYKHISIVGQDDSINLKGSLHSANGLVATADLFASLTDDPMNEPDMGINENERAALELMKQLVEYNVPKEQAAEDVTKRMRLDANTKETYEALWQGQTGDFPDFDRDEDDTGYSRAADNFGDLLGSKVYDMPGFFNVESPDYDGFLDYQGMFRNAFMSTGDWNVARKTANRQFKAAYQANNLNSPDGSDYQITKGPLKGDASDVRKQMIGQLNLDTQKYLVRASIPDQISFSLRITASAVCNQEGSASFSSNGFSMP